jgi:malate dehydrogenase (oxaloacetate-decarboxylating)(NADP+)
VDRECTSLVEAIDLLHPTGLIGVSAIPKMFDQQVCEKMAALNPRPIIFALSNPTSKAECTAQEAYEWTNGTCIFSSGSPFPPVTLADGRTFVPGQGNNAYIFPGVGLGVLAAGSTRITDFDMFLAAETLADCVTDTELATGSLYPPLSKIRDVSAKIATALALHAHETGVATLTKPNDMEEYVKSLMYDPFADPYE